MWHGAPMRSRWDFSRNVGRALVVAVAGIGAIGNVAAAPAGEATEWPRWRGALGDGTWVRPGLPLVLDDDVLELAWRRPIGGGYAGITAVDGRVFTMDRQTEPGEAERIVCLDAATGDLLWEHRYPVEYDGLDYGNGPRASVTVHDGRAYSLGAVGHVRCVDAGSGELVWGIDAVAELGAVRPTWGFAASPVIRNETVICHVGAPGGGFVAFDRATGEERWRGSDDPAGYATPVVVRHADHDLMVAWTPEHIQGLSPDTGEVYWSIPYPVKYGVSIAMPIVHEGIVLVCGYWHGSKAIRLGDKPKEAALLWEDEQNLRGLMAQPLFRDGLVYLLDRTSGLTCFELATGSRRWNDAENHEVTPADRNPQATLVWVRDAPDAPTDRVLAFNANGELLSMTVKPDGFQVHSRFQVAGRTWAHPAYAGDRIIARTDEEIVCWKIAK